MQDFKADAVGGARQTPDPAHAGSGAETAGLYAWTVAVVLAFGQLVAFLDRVVLSLLIGPIKAQLHLTDTELGLLTGLGFALLYCILGVPVGRLIDARSRRAAIVTGSLFWSAMTAASGLTRTFWGLFAARIGVGLGETTLSPGAASILGDYFPPRLLGRAMSLFGFGAYIGTGVAFLAGGAVLHALPPKGQLPFGLEPWQAAFMLASLPGIIFAALVVLVVREPPRRRVAAAEVHGTSMGSAFRYLWNNRGGYGRHFAFCSVVGLFVNSTNAWGPTFLARKFAMAPSAAGMSFGCVVLIAGPLAIFLGGSIADKLWSRRRYDGYVWLYLAASLAAFVPGVLFPLVSGFPATVTLMTLFYFFAVLPIAASTAGLQLMTPPQMRGQVTAVFMSVVSLLGAGLGPPLVAVLTDQVFGGPAGLPRSLSLVIAVLSPLAAYAAFSNRRLFVRTSAIAGALPEADRRAVLGGPAEEAA